MSNGPTDTPTAKELDTAPGRPPPDQVDAPKLLAELQHVWIAAAPLFSSVKATAGAELRLNRMAATQLALIGGVALAVSFLALLFVNAFVVAMLAVWTPLGWPVALLLVALANLLALAWLLRHANSLRGHLGFNRSRADVRRAFAAMAGDDTPPADCE